MYIVFSKLRLAQKEAILNPTFKYIKIFCPIMYLKMGFSIKIYLINFDQNLGESRLDGHLVN